MAKVILVGNIGRDSEMRYTPNGTPVTQVSVADNRTYRDANGEKVKETTWTRCNVWGKLAENLTQYLVKGQQVYIEGRLIPDKTTGGPRVYQKQDGTSGASYEVFVTEIKLIGSKREAEATATTNGDEPHVETQGDEEIPF